MAAKLTKLVYKTAIQLHPVAESCIICSSHSRLLVRKLLDTPQYYPGISLVELKKKNGTKSGQVI
jgi:hypothetical protein